MAHLVIKRDGTREPFDAGKIRHAIEAAAMEAKLSGARVAELVRNISAVALECAGGRDEISATELRDAVLKELDAVEPSAAEAWRQHDRERGRE